MSLGKPPYGVGSKATTSFRVGISNDGEPMIQVNWGGRIYGAPLSLVGQGQEKASAHFKDLRVIGNFLLDSGGSVLRATGEGITILDGGTNIAEFGSTVYVGDQSNEHLKISSTGLEVKDGATVRALFASTVNIADKIKLDSDGDVVIHGKIIIGLPGGLDNSSSVFIVSSQHSLVVFNKFSLDGFMPALFTKP